MNEKPDYSYKLYVSENDSIEGTRIVFTKEFTPAQMFRFSQLMNDYSQADWYSEILGNLSPMQRREIDKETDMKLMVESYQKLLIRLALKTTKGNFKQAASLLKVKRTTLFELAKRIGLEDEDSSASFVKQATKQFNDNALDAEVSTLTLGEVEKHLKRVTLLVERLNSRKSNLQNKVITLNRAANDG